MALMSHLGMVLRYEPIHLLVHTLISFLLVAIKDARMLLMMPVMFIFIMYIAKFDMRPHRWASIGSTSRLVAEPYLSIGVFLLAIGACKVPNICGIVS